MFGIFVPPHTLAEELDEGHLSHLEGKAFTDVAERDLSGELDYEETQSHEEREESVQVNGILVLIGLTAVSTLNACGEIIQLIHCLSKNKPKQRVEHPNQNGRKETKQKPSFLLERHCKQQLHCFRAPFSLEAYHLFRLSCLFLSHQAREPLLLFGYIFWSNESASLRLIILLLQLNIFNVLLLVFACFELSLHQLRIEPVTSNQFLVRALFNEVAFVKHDDGVGILHGRESVGDHDLGHSWNDLLECLLHQSLILSVQGRGSLVKQKDLWLLDDGPGNCDSLLFSSAHSHSKRAHIGAEPVREVLGEVPGVGIHTSLLDFPFEGIQFSEANILKNAHVEEHWLLFYIPNQLLP